ncbi:MAG: hypothetical protein ACFFBS_05890 [Promethearchaeota archaeon]
MSDDLLIEKIAEFIDVFNDMLLLVLTKFPDPLINVGLSEAKVLATENLLNLFDLELALMKKALKTFQRWVEVRENVVNCAKSLLGNLCELTEKKSDLRLRIKLFILPLMEDLLRAISRDRELHSKIGPILPTISSSIERSKSMLQGVSAYFEFAGYNSEKSSLEIEEFFKAIMNRRLDVAEYLLGNMRKRFEKAKQRILGTL